MDLIDKYKMCFTRTDDNIGTLFDIYGTYDIEISENKPIKKRPYTISNAKEKVLKVLKVLKDSVEKMLKMYIIVPTNSDWASPIVLVKKPD